MFENGFVVLSNHFLSTIIPAQSEHLTTKQQEYRQSTHTDSNSKEPRSYLLSLLLWLEDPLDAVVPPLLPLHWPHCTALHWVHPCT